MSNLELYFTFDVCPDKFYFPGKSSKSIFKIDKRISLTFIVSWTSILLKWSNHIMCKISISSYLRKAVCQTLPEDVIYKSNKTNNKFPPKLWRNNSGCVWKNVWKYLNPQISGRLASLPWCQMKLTVRDWAHLQKAFSLVNQTRKYLTVPKTKLRGAKKRSFLAINRDVLSLQKRGRQLCVRKWPEAGTPVPRQVLQAS